MANSQTKRSSGSKLASFCRREKKYLIALAAVLGLILFVLGAYGIYYQIRTSFNTAGLQFIKNEGEDTYSVSGYTGDSKTVVISGKYNGKKVTAIAQSAFSNSAIVSVTMRGIERIEMMAFADCASLETVDLPNSLVFIGGSAFACDTALTEIVLPSSVTELGETAFVSCTSLRTVRLSSALKTIPKQCFGDCTALQTVSLPNSVESIGVRAFELCVGLTSVSGGKNLREIGNYAFAGTSGVPMKHLTDVKLPAGLQSIGTGAFMYATVLPQVTIPASVRTIGAYAFYENGTLNRVTLSEGLTSVGEFAFSGCKNLYFLTVPSSVSEIGCQAFYGNPWLNASLAGENGFVTINGILMGYFGNDTAVSVPTEGFATAYSVTHANQAVTSVTVPSGSCRVLGKQALANCGNLESVVIEEGVTTLGDSLFYYDVKLTQVSLPASLTTIENNVFQRCSAMTTVYFAGTRSQWKALTVGEENVTLLSMKVICESTGPADSGEAA